MNLSSVSDVLTRSVVDRKVSGVATKRRADRGGLVIGPVQSLEHLIEAWQLVYRAYLRIGLVDPNPWRIFTSRHAARPDACTISGRIGGVTVCTLTVMADRPEGLPLDRVYASELEGLRRQGRRLCEIGLLADRREHIARSLPAVIEMMRFGFFQGFHHFSDIMIGVHPHHAGFYERYFAFETAGAETVHPGVKDHPVVLLRLALRENMALRPLPKGLALYAADPLGPEALAQRYCINDQDLHASVIGAFLGL